MLAEADFIDEVVETQRGKITCLKTQSLLVTKPGFELRSV
jgi:hypothetical protein